LPLNLLGFADFHCLFASPSPSLSQSLNLGDTKKKDTRAKHIQKHKRQQFLFIPGSIPENKKMKSEKIMMLPIGFYWPHHYHFEANYFNDLFEIGVFMRGRFPNNTHKALYI